MSSKYEDVEATRASVYGDPHESHIAIGLAWEGIFRNRYHGVGQILTDLARTGTLFPPDLVALMLATFKNVRAARPVFHQDSYDDAHVYLGFSERFRQGEAHGAKTGSTPQDESGSS